MKQYLYLAAATLLFAAFAGTYYKGFSSGVDSEKSKSAKAIEEERERQKAVIGELESRKAEREIVYRDKIKVVRSAADDTGCADRSIPAPILERLLPESSNSKAR